jgi:hypothetical protein
MPKCKNCGKNIKSKDALYKDEKSGEILCGICHIQRLEEDINSSDTEKLEREPTRTKSKKFMITLVLGIILITAEILILSDTSGGKAPDEFPETLSQLSPEFIDTEIKDESIVYEKIPDSGFIIYCKDSEGRAMRPVLSAKGEITISELKKLSN